MTEMFDKKLYNLKLCGPMSLARELHSLFTTLPTPGIFFTNYLYQLTHCIMLHGNKTDNKKRLPSIPILLSSCSERYFSSKETGHREFFGCLNINSCRLSLFLLRHDDIVTYSRPFSADDEWYRLQVMVVLFSSPFNMQPHIEPDFVIKTFRWVWIQCQSAWHSENLPMLTLCGRMFCCVFLREVFLTSMTLIYTRAFFFHEWSYRRLPTCCQQTCNMTQKKNRALGSSLGR